MYIHCKQGIYTLVTSTHVSPISMRPTKLIRKYIFLFKSRHILKDFFPCGVFILRLSEIKAG